MAVVSFQLADFITSDGIAHKWNREIYRNEVSTGNAVTGFRLKLTILLQLKI
jgi:hypothetical protein